MIGDHFPAHHALARMSRVHPSCPWLAHDGAEARIMGSAGPVKDLQKTLNPKSSRNALRRARSGRLRPVKDLQIALNPE